MKISSWCAMLIGAALLSSCSAPKKVAYAKDAELIPVELLSQPMPSSDPIVQAGDILNIQVTGMNYEAVAPFNKNRFVDNKGEVQEVNQNNTTGGNSIEKSTDYYLVDKDGNISFPIIGTLHVAGLTKAGVAELVRNEIYPRYLTEEPVVDIRFMNFRVTILGAVKSPGVKVAQNERLNLFDAIAMAGDLDIKADRENIILIRHNPNGSREVHKLDVHDKNILFSPYYNLQPNDLVLVNWNRSGAQGAWQMNQGFTSTVTVVGGLSAVVGLTISIINLADK